jgi:hypothetical protein
MRMTVFHASSNSEDSTHEEEEEPESGMWRTRNNKNVSAGLPFTYPTAGVTTPNIAFNSTLLESLQLFHINILLMVLVQVLHR